jgi:RNA polymerase sigma factor (TIGR02999 family)
LVPELSPKTVSQLLANWHAGDQEGLHAAIPLVYNELRRIAHRHLRKEHPNHSLQSTALVHEAYVLLAKQRVVQFANRDHFLAICAQLMREILVQHARRQRAAKRNGGIRLTLDDALPFKNRDLNLVALDDALNELAKLNPQQSQIVVLRFFAGLSIEETARAMDLSPATVKRYWETARLWLHHEISKTPVG